MGRKFNGNAKSSSGAAAVDERRIDPADGQQLTLNEVHKKYQNKYDKVQIKMYWANDCVLPATEPAPKEKAKSAASKSKQVQQATETKPIAISPAKYPKKEVKFCDDDCDAERFDSCDEEAKSRSNQLEHAPEVEPEEVEEASEPEKVEEAPAAEPTFDKPVSAPQEEVKLEQIGLLLLWSAISFEKPMPAPREEEEEESLPAPQPEIAAPASPEKVTKRHVSNVASPQRSCDSPDAIQRKTHGSESHFVTVTFSIPYETAPGEEIRVVGNVSKLGQWDPSGAATMQWTDGHVWVTEVDLEIPPAALAVPIEYKYVVMSYGQVSRWEQGENRRLSQPQSGSSLVCKNVWDDVNGEVYAVVRYDSAQATLEPVQLQF